MEKAIRKLSQIVEVEPQAAYPVYMIGFKHKFTFFLRTVPDIAGFLFLIEETLRSRFIPAISRVHIFFSRSKDRSQDI